MQRHLSEMLPPCDGSLEQQALQSPSPAERTVPERTSSRVVELVFLIPGDLNSQAHGTFA